MLQTFNIDDEVYTIVYNSTDSSSIGATIAKGQITAIKKLNDYCYEYTITGKAFEVNRYTGHCFATVDELLNNFRSLIIK